MIFENYKSQLEERGKWIWRQMDMKTTVTLKNTHCHTYKGGKVSDPFKSEWESPFEKH